MYSVVIPVKDEAENLKDLFLELHAVMSHVGKPWEVLFVDDGSKDESAKIIQNLSNQYSEVKLLSFEKNYGQSTAFAAGFSQAKGDYIITLDADGQNNPADIPRLIDTLQEADLVVGWRVERKDNWQKRIISKVSNKIRSQLLHDYMHDTGCSLKLFRKKALEQIKIYDGMHRFFPALFLIEGFVVKETPVSHRPRLKGKTKYHFFNRSIKPFFDLFAVYWMRKRKVHYKFKP